MKAKKGKIFITLFKLNKDQNWFNSLHRSKGLGEEDSDEWFNNYICLKFNYYKFYKIINLISILKIIII